MWNEKRRELAAQKFGCGSVEAVGVRNCENRQVRVKVAKRAATDAAVCTDSSASCEALAIRDSVMHVVSERVRRQVFTAGAERIWSIPRQNCVVFNRKFDATSLVRTVAVFSGRDRDHAGDATEPRQPDFGCGTGERFRFRATAANEGLPFGSRGS